MATREKHVSQYGAERPHGTRSRYVSGCRCEECRASNAAWYRSRVAQKQAQTQHFSRPWKEKVVLGITKDGSQVTVQMQPHCRGPEDKEGVCGTPIKANKKIPLCPACERQTLGNHLVPAHAAKQHMLALRASGIGIRTIGQKAGVSRAILQKIFRQPGKKLRKETLDRIMAVDSTPTKGQHLVDREPTILRLRELRKYFGWTGADIASKLGHKREVFYLVGKKVTLRNAQAVEKLHSEMMAELQSDPGVPKHLVAKQLKEILEYTEWPARKLAKVLGWPNLVLHSYKGKVRTVVAQEVKLVMEKHCEDIDLLVTADDICANCGLSHKKQDRVKRIKMMLPCTVADIVDAYPCIYPKNPSARRGFWENRTLWRDLHAAHAVPPARGDNTWRAGALVPIAKPGPSSEQGHVKTNGASHGAQEIVHVPEPGTGAGPAEVPEPAAC